VEDRKFQRRVDAEIDSRRLKMGKSQPISVEIAPPLPQSREAERAILGAVLLDNQALEIATETLETEDFFGDAHRSIFDGMIALFEGGKNIDLVTLSDYLRRHEELKRSGGDAFIASLVDGVPKVSNVEHYCDIVKRASMLRRIIRIGSLVAEEAISASGEECIAIADRATGKLEELVDRFAPTRLLGKTSKQARISLLQSLEGKESTLRWNVGIETFDKSTGGFRAGELITLTASVTGSGKTLWAQQMRSHACKVQGLHGLYFSGEMPAEQLAGRELATDAGVAHRKIRRPELLTSEDYTALMVAANDCDICRTIDGDFSMRDIRLACRRMQRAGQLSYVVIDYDELVDAPGKDEFAQQRYVVRESKRIATNMRVPVILISGLRKPLDKGEAKKPTLERIYGSGAKSKHSSFVLFIDREYVRELKGDETDARICVLKARDAKIGEIRLKFDTTTLRFRELTEEEQYAHDHQKKGKKENASGN
jgi:replicative DNA helicase